MVYMGYGSALGSFGEQRSSPNAPKCVGVRLGAVGEFLCSPNVPNALQLRILTIFMVRMCYGRALGTIGD